MKVKKFMSAIILSIVAFVTSFTVAFSETPQSAQYTIAVPESVVLNKTTSDGSGTYTGTVSVTAKGSILSDQRVYFSASNPEMHRAGSAAVTGTTTVTTATDWDSTNVTNGTAKTAYTVSANITPGSWTGTMMFFATVSEKYDILLGDKTTLLLAQNENAANVKFSSSAPEIATVDTTGHVQTVSAGDTTITKMVYDSTGKNLLYTTVYNITVSPKQADMVTTRLAEPLKAITAAGTTIDTICFGNYSVPSDVTTYDVSGNGSNTIKAFVDGTALKVTNTRPSPVKFAEGNSVSFSGESAFANIKTVKYESVDTSKVTSANRTFYGMKKLSSITGLENWDTGKITDIRNIFRGCSALTSLDLSKWDTSNVTDMGCAFYGCTALNNLNIGTWNTSKVTAIDCLLYNCSSLPSIDISNWNTGNVTNMNQVFSGCSGLTTLNIGGWNTSKVTTMRYLFSNCSKLSRLALTQWDTAEVTDMRNMFAGCNGLVSLDVKSFNTANVTDMRNMFYYCSSLTTLDVRNFDTTKVTNMEFMFSECSSITTLDVSHFNTASVTNIGNIGGMLSYCNRLTSITVGSNFATANLPEAGWSNGMFYVNTKTALEVKGKISNALKAYDFATDNRVVSYVSGYAVTYIAENGKFSNGTNKNTVVYGEPVETSMTKVSKSGNVSDDGTTFYGYYEPNRETTDRVVIPGATQLTVTITYDTYSASTDWVCVYDGSVTPTASNYRQSVSKKLGGHSTSLKTKTYTIAGDTVQFYFKTNRYRNTDYYGYYATVEGTGYTQPITSGNYEIPSTTANDQAFTGWYNDSSYAIPFSKDDYIITGPTVVYGNVKSMNYVIDKTKLQKGLGNRFTTIIFCNKSDVPTGRVPYSYIQQENSDEIALYQVAETKTVYVAPSYDLDGAPMYAPEDCSRMFYGYSTGMNQSLTEIQFKNFNTSKVTNMEYMFSRNTYLTTLDISGFDMSNVTTIKGLFQWDGYLEKISAPNWNTSNLTDMSYAFDSCQKIQSIDIKNWDTSKVTTMSYAFDNCLALTSVNCNNWNTSSVTNMNHMFYQCCSLTNVPVSNWDTSKVEDMGYLFNSVGAYMNEVSLDVGNWNTSNVTNMNYLFCSTKCNSIDVSNWDTRNVTSMAWMFRATNCTTIKISNFDTSSVTDFSNMFDSCKNLTDLYVGKRFATANLPTTRGNGMFNFNSDNYGKHINIHGQVSDALKAYDYNNDKVGTPNFVDSQSLLANVFVTIATPETATQYDERPAA